MAVVDVVAQTVEEALIAAGHVEDDVAGTVRVVNTCCITGEAERKSRKQVRRAADAAGRRNCAELVVL